MDKALARTFYGDDQVEVEILSAPSSTGLCKVKCTAAPEGAYSIVFVRNKVQLKPLNEAARHLLGVANV